METKVLRIFFAAFNFFCILSFCAAQQNLPSRIIGGIPGSENTALYEIQVGAFFSAQNLVNTSNLLERNGFNPVFENFRNLTRVIIPGIPANEIISNLERLKRLGFDEVIIRKNQASAIDDINKQPLTLDESTTMETLLKASDDQITGLVINEVAAEMGIPAESISVEYILRDNANQAMAVKLSINQ